MAARAAGIRFPRLTSSDSTTYIHFLKQIVEPEMKNRRAFALTEQSHLLGEYERQLKEVFAHDLSRVGKKMEEVSTLCWPGEPQESDAMLTTENSQARSKASHSEWEKLKRQLSYLVKERDQAGETGALDLPKVGRAHGAKHDVYDKQTYADFASKAEKQNADFGFDKPSMDRAFTLAAQMAKKKIWKASDYQFDRMMTRCLGKESDEYWRGR